MDLGRKKEAKSINNQLSFGNSSDFDSQNPRRKDMKKIVRIVSLVLMISFLAACATPTAAPVATQAPVVATTEAPLSAAEQWAKDNGVGVYQPETEDWAAIEAAAKEEGSVIVYSNSSRVQDAAAVWATLYPDITIEANDMGGAEVITKVREEQKAGSFAGDVWFSAGGPDLEGEFVPNQYIWKFIPPELLSVLPEANQNPVVTASTETFGWVYNSELNDACPISNWWELTEPAWKGKVFIKDPINSAEDLGMLMSAVKHADDFAAAYKAYYGTDIVLDADTPDAGWMWIKKFAQNQPVGVGGSDDVWGAMAIPGLKDNMLGWLPLSKYRNVTSGKAVFEPCADLTPVAGVQKHNYLAIINQAPHPNAAKLFIRFALSEEGFAPWNQVGQYSGRTDITPIEAALKFKSLNVYNFDNQFVYGNITAYHDFYALNLLTQ
jgi:iron(III) transport system substrate-binding protein